MTRPAILISLVVACGGSGDGQVSADSSAADTTAPVVIELAMPDAPSASRGRIALRSAGAVGLDGQWSARAGWCADPAMLQVLVEEQDDSMILLLALPDGDRVTNYPVTAVADGIPEGPVSRAGVQRIVEGRPYAWQAEHGAVDLYAWDDDRVSGRFALTMRNIATNERSLVAGSFLGVQTMELGPEQCQPSAPPPAN